MYRRRLGIGCFCAVLLGFQNVSATAAAPEQNWKRLEPGLEYGVFVAPQRAAIGDSRVRVLRISPRHFKFRLMSASAVADGKTLTAREWSRKYGLVAAINASMYQKDYRTSVSLMRNRKHVNNPRLSKDNSILAFDRRSKSVPRVKMIDRQCDNFNHWRKHYATLVQSIRMLSCKGKNVWQQQNRRWSTGAIGTDKRGRVLFIHVRSPYSTHDLINNLMQLPLSLKRLMYVEGGPEAQLYIRSGKREYEFFGSFETGFNENNNNRFAWPVPNVIGISRRRK